MYVGIFSRPVTGGLDGGDEVKLGVGGAVETVDMHFSAEEKELTSDSRFKGSGGLRMRKCNFAAKDQHPVESFKSSFLHRIADKCAII